MLSAQVVAVDRSPFINKAILGHVQGYSNGDFAISISSLT